MVHIGCKHLDYETKYLDCELITTPEGWKYWRRGKTWVTDDMSPTNVQFCGKGKGRINGIFQCINPGEMSCFEAQDDET